VLIYEDLDLPDEASALRQKISRVLAHSFSQTNTSFKFVRDSRWGGVVLNTSRLSVLLDRGTGYYSNSPQYFGYMMYAASVVVKRDTRWLGQAAWVQDHKLFGDTLSSLIMNVQHNNASLFNGALDFYTGRSWTKGVVEGEREESFS